MARTKRERRAEVEAWRSSGLTMTQFASRGGYSRSSLEKWARAARDEEAADTSIQESFVRLEVARISSEVVVEVGGARVRVHRGFDRELLTEVVTALLAGGAR